MAPSPGIRAPNHRDACADVGNRLHADLIETIMRLTARACVHGPHPAFRKAPDGAGRHRPPEQGEHPHNGCSPCFLPRCSGIPRNRISNSAPTFEGLFEVFRWAVLRPFRAPARTKPLRRSFAGLCWALFAPLPERSPCEGLSEVFRWALGGHA